VGERTALYLSFGIHLASDVAERDFGPLNYVESPFIKSGRKLKEAYQQNKAALDQFMQAKDASDLIGIYELTAPNGFQNLPAIQDFTLALHEYASRYIEQLGARGGNAALEDQGQKLSGDLKVGIKDLSPAREEIMWEKIKYADAKGYLIVGMGDAHRVNLHTKLMDQKIDDEEVKQSLKRQSGEVAAGWKK
jgi:hypothetical protein